MDGRGVELHRASSERKLELATAAPLSPARRASLPEACCTSARASGIPASRCRAGRFRASGARTARRCGKRRTKTLQRASGDAMRVEDARPLRHRARAGAFDLSPDYVMPAYEDPWRILRDEANLPVNVDLLAEDTEDRGRAPAPGRSASPAGIGKPAGYVLPLKPIARAKPIEPTTVGELAVAAAPREGVPRRGRFADRLSPAARLASRGACRRMTRPMSRTDPFDRRDALGKRKPSKAAQRREASAARRSSPRAPRAKSCKIALCRRGAQGPPLRLPPAASTLLEDFISLVGAIESTAQALELPVRLEGYRAARRSAPRPLRRARPIPA